MWKVPLFNLDLDSSEIRALSQVIKKNWLTMGEQTKEFEDRFGRYIGVKHAIAVSNCTAALHLANLAIGIGKGDEVITPSLTFVAGPNSILYAGAKPVFADITNMDNFNISPEDIKRKMTKKTKAIHIMHYAGFPCDMDKIIDIASHYDIPVIEDASHAIGSLHKGRKCGSIGKIGCFSFFSNKNMTTGEGGMIVTNEDEIAGKIKLMRSHGMSSLTLDRYRGHAFDYDVVRLGFNYRIDELRSAIGISQLKKLEMNNAKRRKLATLYREKLNDINGINIPFVGLHGNLAEYIFPILLRKSDKISFMKYMKSEGIQTSIHYLASHRFSFYKKVLGYDKISLPLTEKVSEREVTLPLYPSMTKKEIYHVIKKVRSFFNKRKEI